MKISGRYLVVVVAMCGLAAATVGLTTNVAGLFFTPMADEFGVMRGTASLTLTISNICVALGGLVTRRLTKIIPLRALLVAGVGILAGSALGTAFAPSISIAYLLAATRGLSGGVIGFVLITYVLNKWFVAQLGLATSIAMGFSGLAGALFTPIIQPVVTGMGWRAGYIVVAVLSVLLSLPAILFVPSCDPADVDMRPLGSKDEPTQAQSTQDKRQPIKVDKVLCAIVVLYAALAGAVSAMPQHFPGLATEAGLAASVGAAMISACMVANTLGKVFMGWLIDRIGAKASIMFYTALVIASIVAMFFVRVPIAFIVAAVAYGLCYARATVGVTMMCREVFGKRGFGIVYPVAALGTSIANAIFSAAVGFGYDLTGGYTISLVTFLAFLVISIVLVQWCYANIVTKA